MLGLRRRLKPSLTFLALLVLPSFYSANAETEPDFSVYLVRHAEKQAVEHNGDPGLTRCGQLRASALADVLSELELDAVFSTNYRRTLQTATPPANSLGLEVTLYAPHRLEEFARQLEQNRQDALVVGHSNTTVMLAQLLSGQVLQPMDEKTYDRLYQVSFGSDSVSVEQKTQDFVCVKSKGSQ